MSKSFEVRGVDGLLKQLHKNANLDDVKNVVKMNATELERNAKRDAPVDTGFLRRSIGLEFEDAGFTARVMATAEYAPYLEFGTRFMSAQPFIRPSFYPQSFRFKQDLDRLMK